MTTPVTPLRRFRLVPGQLRWQLVLALAPVVIVLLGVLGVTTYRAASEIVREQALQQLQSLRVTTARAIERHFTRVESQLVSLARDPGTLSALKQLGDGTAALDNDPLTEPAKMRPQMESLKRFFENYYQRELSNKVIDLRTLLLPQRSAVWLQAAYLARSADPIWSTTQPDAKDATYYARSHAAWDPVFRGMLDRFGFEDLYLIDAASGRVVYSARKQPDFQTSLLDGPYTTSTIGVLFRKVREAGHDRDYRIIDFAAYPPAHGRPAAFAGTPILDNGRTVGVLVVQLSSEPLTHILSADGQWAQTGLGETGEMYLVGRGDGDSLMRSESRFGSVGEDTTSVLRQRVESQVTSVTNHADDYQGEYTNYRGVPVLGSAGRLSHLNGLNWTLIAEMNTAEALRPLSPLRTRTLWLTILLLVAALLLILGISTAMTAPGHELAASTVNSDVRADEYERRLKVALGRVMTAATAASEGDLSQRITSDGSLLGELPRLLNRMWRNVGTLVRHVTRASTTAIESATQIQTAVRQLSQDAVQHTTELAATHARLRETRSRLDTLAAETTAASQTEQLTDAAAHQGAEAADHAVAGMEALQKHTRTLTMKMKRLGERSMEISTVTTTIQEITAQANMLALNATIEASRAGEHGLGFKTVANDVRKLATRTETAAKDMAHLVTTLHSEAADAVDCIDQQADEIERQTAVITDAAHTLSRCRDAWVQSRGRVSAVSPAAGEEARAVATLSDAMLRLAEFVRRTHVLSEQTVHSSAALLQMLSELRTWAQTFRVRAGSDTSAPSSAKGDVIELAPHDTVGNGRGAGASRR